MNSQEVEEYVDGLTALARQLNAFASGLKTVRTETKKPVVREPAPEYVTTNSDELPDPLFSEEDLNFLNN